MIDVDDDGRVETVRKLRIVGCAEDGPDVRQVLALCPAPDGVEHRRLNVFGVDEAVLRDPARELDREPPAARPKVGDDRAFGDVEIVHDLFGRLPLIAVWRLDQSQFLRGEETVLPLHLSRRGGESRWAWWAGGAGETGGQVAAGGSQGEWN